MTQLIGFLQNIKLNNSIFIAVLLSIAKYPSEAQGYSDLVTSFFVVVDCFWLYG